MRLVVKHLLRVPSLIWSGLIELSVLNMPGPLGRALRYRYYRGRLKSLGKGVKFDVGIRILNPEHVSIGDNTWIDNYVVIVAGSPSAGDGPTLIKENLDFDLQLGEVKLGSNVHIANFVVIQGHGGVKIGNNLTVASGSKIYSMSHHHSNLVDRTDPRKYKFTGMVPRSEQSLIIGPVVVGNDAAIGLNSIILPGVTVGTGSWVGAASVVEQSLPANILAKGNPAKIVKSNLHPNWMPESASNG